MDEALPLHSGRADPIDCPKCGQLGCVIFVSGGLRSRYPLIFSEHHGMHAQQRAGVHCPSACPPPAASEQSQGDTAPLSGHRRCGPCTVRVQSRCGVL